TAQHSNQIKVGDIVKAVITDSNEYDLFGNITT
ncbi:MAG: hypothetical protein QG673_1424, partial [Pseudomonadota bacterium]|nr:hypothetical protein [Pseudomonadota bacterium]